MKKALESFGWLTQKVSKCAAAAGKSWRSWLPAAMGILLCAVFLPILAVNITLLIKAGLYPNEVPSVCGVAPVVVQSNAMQPAFGANDLVMVTKAEPAALSEGDVIAYQTDGRLLFGRITARALGNDGGVQFFVKADGASAEDVYPVTGARLVGQYRLRLAGLGGVALFLQSPAGIICFLILPFLLLLGWDAGRKWLRRRKKPAADADAQPPVV